MIQAAAARVSLELDSPELAATYDEVSTRQDRVEQSSSFGNFLSDVPSSELPRLKARLSKELESRRRGGKILLERYLVFATARRP